MTSTRKTDAALDEATSPADEATAEPEAPQFTPPYLGQVVYVERADPDTGHSSYDDGSYLVIEETSGELFCISLHKFGAYEFHQPKAIPLVGAGAYRVLAVDAPTARIVGTLDGAAAEAYDVLTGVRQGHWNNSVYERAYVRAIQARHLIADQLGLPPNPDEPTFPAPAKPTVVKVPTAKGSTAVAEPSATETRALLEPLVELLKPLTLAGASAELHVVFPAATSAEQKAEADRRAATRRLGEAIIATSLHPDNR